MQDSWFEFKMNQLWRELVSTLKYTLSLNVDRVPYYDWKTNSVAWCFGLWSHSRSGNLTDSNEKHVDFDLDCVFTESYNLYIC